MPTVRRDGGEKTRTPSPIPIAGSGGSLAKWRTSIVMLPGSRISWSTNGGIQSTAPMPSVTRNGRSTADRSSCRRSRHPIAARTSTLIAIVFRRYDTCVWAATDAVTTATTAIQWSPTSTDQAAASTTSHSSTGK